MEAFIHGANVDGEGAVALSSCGPTRCAEDTALRPQSEKRVDFRRGESQRDCQRRRSECHYLDGSQWSSPFTVYCSTYSPVYRLISISKDKTIVTPETQEMWNVECELYIFTQLKHLVWKKRYWLT